MAVTYYTVKSAVLRYLTDPKMAEKRLEQAKVEVKKYSASKDAVKSLAASLAAVTKTVQPGTNNRTDTAIKGLATHLPTVQNWANTGSAALTAAKDDVAIYTAIKAALKDGIILWSKNKPVRVVSSKGFAVVMLLWDVVANKLNLKPLTPAERAFGRITNGVLVVGNNSTSEVHKDETAHNRALNGALDWVVSNKWYGKP